MTPDAIIHTARLLGRIAPYLGHCEQTDSGLHNLLFLAPIKLMRPARDAYREAREETELTKEESDGTE